MFVMKEGFAECWVCSMITSARNTTDVRVVGRNFRARETARPSCRSPK
jgi:hypothetical protein